MGEEINIDDIFNEYASLRGDVQLGPELNLDDIPEYIQEEGDGEEENEMPFEGLHYQATFKDYERVGEFGGEKLPQEFAKLGLYMMTEKDILRNKFYKATTSDYFHQIDEDELIPFRKYVFSEIEPKPETSHMNVQLLVLAAYFLWSKKEFDKKGIGRFLKDKERINPIDFLRYIRFLQK